MHISWRVLGHSERGYNHILNKMKNQDAIKRRNERDCVMVLVADGHGSVMRARKGAKIAVNTGYEVLHNVWEVLKKDPDQKNIQNHQYIAEAIIPKSLISLWRERVLIDFYENPIPTINFSNVFHLYGTTLLAALVTRKFILYLQIGDGDIIIVSRDGHVSRVIPIRPELIYHQTTSLCQNEPERYMDIVFQPIQDDHEPPSLIMISSDGYSNSYPNDADFFRCAIDYLHHLQNHGEKYILARINKWLQYTTKHGSRDDITVGLIFNSEEL